MKTCGSMDVKCSHIDMNVNCLYIVALVAFLRPGSVAFVHSQVETCPTSRDCSRPILAPSQPREPLWDMHFFGAVVFLSA